MYQFMNSVSESEKLASDLNALVALPVPLVVFLPFCTQLFYIYMASLPYLGIFPILTSESLI